MISTDKRLRISRWLTVLLLCFIWGNSLLPGDMSLAFSNWVKIPLEGVLPEQSPGVASGHLLRKLAHMIEFAALGACLCWQFSMRKKKRIYALVYGFGAACVDETIQRFVPDRGPSLSDVALDTCGVAAGMVLLMIGHHYISKYLKGDSTQ